MQKYSEYENNIDFAREEIYAVEKGKSIIEESYEIVRLFTKVRNITEYKTNDWRDTISEVIEFIISRRHKVLFRMIYFDDFYDKMKESECREFMAVLLDNVQIYEERQSNGQWVKFMEFKLPIIKEDMKFHLDNDSHIETACLLAR